MKKSKLTVLSLVMLSSFSLNVLHNNFVVHAQNEVSPIEDDLNDLTSENKIISDYYNMAPQTGDVGFGNDVRLVSTYQATSAPTSSTMWENYGYIEYTIEDLNTLEVICDESTSNAIGAPLVYAFGSNMLLECSNITSTTSTNWTRRTYTYSIANDATKLRIIPVSYNVDDNVAVWSQQITKVVIKNVVEQETPTPTDNKVEDEFDDLTKTSDYYQIALQSTDVGFGSDNRYITSKAPTVPATSENWWDENYAYIQYNATNKNIVKVCVDTDPSKTNILPHIGLVANYGGSSNQFLEVNNYEVTTSTNWSRITYTFVLDENVQWVRVVYTVYNSYDGRLETWMQQVTSVTLDKVTTLPEKTTVPTIDTIEKPTITDVETINETCDTLEGNTNFNDYYRTKTSNGKIISFADATQEYTDATWWEASNGYCQVKVNQHNLLTIDVLVEKNAAKYIKPVGVYAGAGNSLSKVNINNVIKGDEVDGYIKYQYVYILTNSPSVARLVISSYNSPDGLILSASQQIDNIKLEYVENLPVADVIDTSHDESKEAIDTYLNTINKTDYSSTAYDYIVYYANKAKYDLVDSTDDDAIINELKNTISKVKTLLQEANEAKNNELNEFATFFNSLDQDKYTATNWTIIANLYNEAISELENVTDLTQIKQIISDVKEDILDVEEIKDTPVIPSDTPSTPSDTPSSSEDVPSLTPSDDNVTSNSNSTNTSSNGCNGATLPSMISISLLSLLTLISKKNKKQ